MTDTIDLKALTAAILSAYPDQDPLFNAILNAWGLRVSDLIFVRQADGNQLERFDR